MEKRQTEITFEKRTMTVIRIRGNRAVMVDCEACGRHVSTISRAYASVVFGVGGEQLERLVRSGGIHQAANANLCGESLTVHFNQDTQYRKD